MNIYILQWLKSNKKDQKQNFRYFWDKPKKIIQRLKQKKSILEGLDSYLIFKLMSDISISN